MTEHLDEFDFEPETEEVKEEASDGGFWINRGRKDPIKVRLNTYKGHTYVDIREWWLPRGEADEKANYKPGKNGLTFNPQAAQELTEAITEVLSQIQGD